MKKIKFLLTALVFAVSFSSCQKDLQGGENDPQAGGKTLFTATVEALKAGSFVLEADNVSFPNGITRYVSSTTNYIQVDNGEGIVQTAFNNFAYTPGPNGLGGVTVQGNINGLKMKEDKDGNYYYNYTIQGVAISATVFITLTGGTNQASVQISPNFNNNKMMMTGRLLPLDESDVFQGTTW